MNCILIGLVTAAVACVLFAGAAPEQTAADVPVGHEGPAAGGEWRLYVKMPPEPSQSK